MALEGVRVIDMTIWQHGPVGTAMLADMGAEVIKVEERQSGDPGRQMGHMWAHHIEFPLDPYFENNNRNKKSLAIDLKKERGREVLYRLVKESDVFASNFREAALTRLHLDYPTLKKLNPKIIYAHAYSYGPKGLDKDKPSADLAAQARGGIMSQWGPNVPYPVWGGLADQVGAMIFAYGMMVALFAREKTGVGQEVDTSLLGSQIHLGSLPFQEHLFTGHIPEEWDQTRPLSPLWNVYKTKDGRWLGLSFLGLKDNWHNLCRVLELEELEHDPKFDPYQQNRYNWSGVKNPLVPILDRAFAKRTLAEWTTILNQLELPWAPVQNYAEVAADPQVVENEYIVDVNHPNVGPIKMIGIPVHLSETPGKVRNPAPELGQHTEEVLLDICGYTWDEISSLREEQVI